MAVVVNPNQNQTEEQKGQNSLNPLQTVGTAAPSGQGASGSPMARQTANTLAQQQRQGSGRFTNLQKYLQANQQGGQQVASQVGQNINKELSEKQNKAQQYYTQLGQSINQANQTAQEGMGFQNQLKGMQQNIQAAQQAGLEQRDSQASNLDQINQFTQSPNFQRFQDIQAGRGIDESLLSLQQQRSLTQAQQAAEAAQQSQGMLGTEGGRFELLRKAFGGAQRPGYSQGQQRLDQVLLGQGGGLGQLQADVAQQSLATQQQARQASEKAMDVNRLTNQERGLIEDINAQAKANEEAYINMLGSYVDPLNKQRQAEWDTLNQAISAYKPGAIKAGDSAVGRGLTNEQLARLGVTKEYGAFDVLENLADANAVARQGRMAQGFQDTANEADVNRYAALARIMNLNPGESRLTQASNLGDAYTAAEGDANLAKRLESAQKLFDERMKGQQFGHYIEGSRGKDMFGGVKRYHGGANAAAQDLFNQNQAAIKKFRGGDTRGGWGGNEENASADVVWNQFKNWLDEQKFSRTIGGTQSAPEDIYGRRATAGGLEATQSQQTGKLRNWEDPRFANNTSNVGSGKKSK